ncbi:hypothetical protein [Stutzerimonas kunmingensis]|nr:hypothetical protein [Stutzerimonas kunmingensis]
MPLSSQSMNSASLRRWLSAGLNNSSLPSVERRRSPIDLPHAEPAP